MPPILVKSSREALITIFKLELYLTQMARLLLYSSLPKWERQHRCDGSAIRQVDIFIRINHSYQNSRSNV